MPDAIGKMGDTPENTTHMRNNPVLRALVLGVVLAIAWLLWSGLYKPLLLSLGLFSCAITLVVLQRMGYFSNETFAFRYSLLRLFSYWLWLGKEIVMSSLAVTRLILRRHIDVQPKTITLDVSQLDALDQAMFGNSITLTPGTLTLDLFKDRIVVHALTEEAATALETGEMKRRVEALKDD